MKLLPLLLLLALPAAVQAQFTFTTNNGTITITGYTGPGGAVPIPDMTNGLPVTSIDGVIDFHGFPVGAFEGCTSLTSVTIPNSVTRIGHKTFEGCTSLTSITIGNSVANIGYLAFQNCSSLIVVMIPQSITNIGCGMFRICTNLTSVYFQGNAPSIGSNMFCFNDDNLNSVFFGDNNATVYYLPGITGWGTTFGSRATAPWFLPNPLILINSPSFGVQTNRFGFIISWATNIPVVVEACTNLGNHAWSPVSTNTLTDGWSYFSDPQWGNYPAHFYRIRSP